MITTLRLDGAEQHLLGLFDFERQRMARRLLKPFTLERVQLALKSLGNPAMDKPIIHIAGTKGKGSTAMLLHHVLSKQGLKVGLFTSPHLISLTERIRLGDECIAIAQMERHASHLHKLNEREFGGDLTFFEFLFLMAMSVFEEQKMDYIVLETGLGGRLDATNVVQPIVSVLTRIDFDHCDILGNTLTEIAREKAGIIKSQCPVVALHQSEEVEKVFNQFAETQSTSIVWSEHAPSAKEQNAQLVNTVLEALGFPKCSISELLNLHLPGRLHHVEHQGQKFILDTAHNAISMDTLMQHLGPSSQQTNVLFAMGESRPPKELLRPLVEKVSSITFVELPGDRPRVEPMELLRVWKALGGNNAQVLTEPDAIYKWMSQKSEAAKLITGSFYLVGEAYGLLEFSPNQMIAH